MVCLGNKCFFNGYHYIPFEKKTAFRLIECIANCKRSGKNIAGATTLLDKNKSEVALHVKIIIRRQCYLYMDM